MLCLWTTSNVMPSRYQTRSPKYVFLNEFFKEKIKKNVCVREKACMPDVYRILKRQEGQMP